MLSHILGNVFCPSEQLNSAFLILHTVLDFLKQKGNKSSMGVGQTPDAQFHQH
jgi:hypothetical protein